jgi:hypothetical protein
LLKALLDDDFAGSAGSAASVVTAGRAVTAVAAVAAGAVAVFNECDEVFAGDVLTVAWTVALTASCVVASLHTETNELAIPILEWLQ